MHPIRVMNWSNAIIENNYFKDVTPDPDNNKSAVYASGAINPTFQNNTIINVARPMQFTVAKNIGAGSDYKITYNQLSEENIQALATNTIVNGFEDFIRINKVYQKYDRENTDLVFIKTSDFTDVTAQNSHYEGIAYWSSKGVINGYNADDTTKLFKPDNTLSRSHTAVMFSRALDLAIPEDYESILNNFKDVPTNHPYAKEIAAAYQAGIFKGNNGLFLDNKPLTREQMASVLVKAFSLVDNGKNLNVNLANVDPSHQINVQIIANLGITNQLSDFKPSSPVTRGQFATFLYRAEQVKANS
jgi:S-layer homology domain